MEGVGGGGVLQVEEWEISGGGVGWSGDCGGSCMSHGETGGGRSVDCDCVEAEKEEKEGNVEKDGTKLSFKLAKEGGDGDGDDGEGE